jgi:hypothetical protein
MGERKDNFERALELISKVRQVVTVREAKIRDLSDGPHRPKVPITSVTIWGEHGLIFTFELTTSVGGEWGTRFGMDKDRKAMTADLSLKVATVFKLVSDV